MGLHKVEGGKPSGKEAGCWLRGKIDSLESGRSSEGLIDLGNISAVVVSGAKVCLV